jgi:hypothetical protein
LKSGAKDYEYFTQKSIFGKMEEILNSADLPIVFYYSDDPFEIEKMPLSNGWSCLICELKKIRDGESLALMLLFSLRHQIFSLLQCQW